MRGYFWLVFMATVAYYLEGVVIHGGAVVAGRLRDPPHLGAWMGGSIVATLVMPLAAFATSLVHSSTRDGSNPFQQASCRHDRLP